MVSASEQVAKQYTEAGLNKKNWGTAMYNVLVEGLVGDGVTDDTAALQALVNTAIAGGRKTIFFPHGSYFVTALTNANQVVFVGDNASFVGGHTGDIIQFGEGGVTEAEFAAFEAETTNQLALKVDKVTGKGLSTNDYSSTDKTEVAKIANKADITYVNTQIASVASGSPKGTYATLTALQTAFPTGNTNIYLVTADGKWYYWSGSAWTAGGVYQSTGIVDQSVTPQKTDFLIPDRINFVDPTKMTQGFVDQTNGTITFHADAYTSDFIPVVEGGVYSTNGTWNSGYYDVNKVFVQGVPFLGANMTVPTGVGIKYVRNAFGGSVQFNQPMYVKGAVLPGSFVPYDEYNIKLTDKFRQAIGNISPLSGMKWNALGDSITESGSAYHFQIAQRTGIIVRNYGISATRITTEFASGMAARYVDMDNDADIITVFGGTNDFGNGIAIGTLGDTTGATLYGAMKILIEGLLTKYPGKRIGFILPTPREGQTSPSSGLKNYVNVIKEMCDRYSIPTLDLYTGSGLAPDYPASKTATIPDGLHPNEAGHILISRKIEDFLMRI